MNDIRISGFARACGRLCAGIAAGVSFTCTTLPTASLAYVWATGDSITLSVSPDVNGQPKFRLRFQTATPVSTITAPEPPPRINEVCHKDHESTPQDSPYYHPARLLAN